MLLREHYLMVNVVIYAYLPWDDALSVTSSIIILLMFPGGTFKL